MKKIIFSTILGITAIGGALFFNSASESTAEVQVVDYFDGDPVNVYELSNDDAIKGMAKFKKAAQKVGVTFGDAEAKMANNRVAFIDTKGADASRHFEYDAAKGSLSFNKGVAKQILSTTSKLPSEKDAPILAEKFLADNDLLPAAKGELKLEHVGGIKRVSSKDKKEYDVMKTVTYSRLLNGVPVAGEGSKVVVEMGDKGEVLAVTRKWREVKSTAGNRTAAPDMKSQNEAEAEFRKIVSSQFGSEATSKLNTVSKLYYDGGDKYIQPIYLMSAKVKFTQDGQTIERDFIQPVSMLKIAPEAIKGGLEDLTSAKAKSEIKTLDEKQKNNPPVSKAPKRDN